MSSHTVHPVPGGPQAALNAAAAVAGLAPSVHNTQPWRWRTRTGVLSLWADRSRQLSATDPDGRMLTLSCGASLHHARVALAAYGYGGLVRGWPDPAQPDLLARLGPGGPIRVTSATMRLYQAIGVRGTDRRPVPPEPLDDNGVLALTVAVQEQGCRLQPLRHDQVIELAAIVSRAQHAQQEDPAWRGELVRWSGAARPTGLGVPDANIPQRPPRTTVPGRDFGHPGTLPVDGDGEHDHAARYAVLYTDEDTPADWLRAGQALSAAWLTATDLGLSVLPVSAPVEVPPCRELLRGLLSGLGYPCLVLRLGMAAPGRAPAPTPRLDTAWTVVPDAG
jgi:nitroreductase